VVRIWKKRKKRRKPNERKNGGEYGHGTGEG